MIKMPESNMYFLIASCSEKFIESGLTIMEFL